MPRTYVSDELTHFVGRGLPTDDARYELLADIILRNGCLKNPKHPGSRYGRLQSDTRCGISHNNAYQGNYTCFCDIPPSSLGIHMKKYSPFGIAFRKNFLVAQGTSPVFYVAKSAQIGIGKSKADAFDEYFGMYHSLLTQETPGEASKFASQFGELAGFLDWEVFSHLKVLDPACSDDDAANYYMEREWRVIGEVHSVLADVCRIIVPAAYRSRLQQELPAYCGVVTSSDSEEIAGE